MRVRLGVLLLLPTLLGGCALPLEYNLASYAIDGLSYLFSGKSATDHAISTVTERDCALLRAFDGDEICHDAAPDIDDVVERDGPTVREPVTVAELPPLPQVEPASASLATARPLPKPAPPMLALDAARPLPKPSGWQAAGDSLAAAIPQAKPTEFVTLGQVAALAR
ncbi:MAG: hypothetical protein AB7N54_18270 [Alphaproteobacteria bacterium]